MNQGPASFDLHGTGMMAFGSDNLGILTSLISAALFSILSWIGLYASPNCDAICDALELNHYYDSDARPVFTQLIGWNHERDGKEHVAFWKIRPAMCIDRSPRGGVVCRLATDDLGVLRIEAASYRETHTQEDPELLDRSFRSAEVRRGIRGRFK